MNRSTENRWLHYFALLTGTATLLLIGLGGLVTSHGVGLAVPDWPTTYGYNMFLFPVSHWTGGILYEHSHRLFASFVGLLTTILAIWLWMREERRWLRWLGVLAFVLVVLQGVLGGLRVTLLKDQIGIFHAVLAQSFLLLVFAIAIFTSRWWLAPKGGLSMRNFPGGMRFWLLLATGLIFAQLILGAAMRHQHAGLAVPDFPLAYGKVWPPTDPEFLERINWERIDYRNFGMVTANQIYLHMGHRIGAVSVLGAVLAFVWAGYRRVGAGDFFFRAGVVWLFLVVAQGTLGAFTVWTDKAADVATLHVMMGAVTLLWGAFLSLLSYRATGTGDRGAEMAVRDVEDGGVVKPMMSS